MSKFAKFSNIRERYYPLLLSIIVVGLTFSHEDRIFIKDIACKAFDFDIQSLLITIESILLGFILTVLALVMQIDNNAMRAIREANRYKDLVKYNEYAAYSTFISIVLSAVFIFTSNRLVDRSVYSSIFLYTWEFFIVYSFISTYRFMRIFFVIAKSDSPQAE